VLPNKQLEFISKNEGAMYYGRFTCAEANQWILPTIKPSRPPSIDRSHVLCRDSTISTGVLIIDRLHITREIQLYVLLYEARVKWTEMGVFIIHTAIQNNAYYTAIQNNAYYTAIQNNAYYTAIQNNAHYTAIQNNAHYTAIQNNAHYTAIQNNAYYTAIQNNAYYTAIQNNAH